MLKMCFEGVESRVGDGLYVIELDKFLSSCMEIILQR